MRILLTFFLAAGFAHAQDPAVQRIHERCDSAKPGAERLAFYSLDWAMSLKDAKARAAKESRPILLVLNTNISAGTNFFSGHT